MNLIDQAKNKMIESELSCYAYLKVGEYTSQYSGIRPLLQPLNKDCYFFEDAIVIDKVIGKSAAFLLIYGKVKKVHAFVMSEHAKNLLDLHNINYSYDKLVPYIENNIKTDMCPMEKTVLEIEEVNDAFNALNRKVDELMKKRDL
jgi:iron complex outermembrane receptor protein